LLVAAAHEPQFDEQPSRRVDAWWQVEAADVPPLLPGVNESETLWNDGTVTRADTPQGVRIGSQSIELRDSKPNDEALLKARRRRRDCFAYITAK